MSRSCGSTGSTCRSSTCSTRALPVIRRRRRSRSRSKKAPRVCATGRTCYRWTTRRPRMSSPVFSYPYSRTRDALSAMQRTGPPHPCHGAKMRFVNPATGRHTDADDRRVHAAAAGGFRRRGVPRHRCHGLCGGRGTRRDARGRRRATSGAHATSSWCRRGCRCHMRRAKRRCCSACPIVPRSRRWVCGGKRRRSISGAADSIAPPPSACNSRILRLPLRIVRRRDDLLQLLDRLGICDPARTASRRGRSATRCCSAS